LKHRVTEAVTVERLRTDGALAASGERLAVAVQPWRWTAWIAAANLLTSRAHAAAPPDCGSVDLPWRD